MPEDVPQVQVTTTNKTSWEKIGLTVLIILVVTGLIAGVYWFFILDKSSDNSDLTGPVPKPNVPTATPSATSSALKDETVDWETYSNSTYKFSFKYDKDKHGKVSEAKNPNPGELLYVNVQINGPVFNLSVLEAGEQKVIDNIKSGCTGILEFSETKKTVINGVEWTEVVCKNSTSGEDVINWVLNNSGYIYKMNGSSEITSTFKFLD